MICAPFFDYNESAIKPQPSLYGTQCSMQNNCLQWIARKAGKENIFGEVRPVHELIARVHQLAGQPLKSSQILNYFTTFINNEVKLFKCKFHLKQELEREDLKKKGLQLRCALATVRYIGFLLVSIMNKELKKPGRRRPAISNPKNTNTVNT